MGFHEIEAYKALTSRGYFSEPPASLGVIYEGQKYALAIYREPFYEFVISDEMTRRIEAGELKPIFVFSGPGNPSSMEFREGFELASITLVPAADYELRILRV